MVTIPPTSVLMFCDPCGEDREFIRGRRDRLVTVRGEEIPVAEPVFMCPSCGATQPDLSEGIDSLKLAYDEYRRRHGLLTPAQIVKIREQYALSREAFASVLGMSAATLYRYEGGALQDDLHDSMIFACEDPATMQRLVNRHPDRLSGLQRERFEEAIHLAAPSVPRRSQAPLVAQVAGASED